MPAPSDFCVKFVCPKCRAEVVRIADAFVCTSEACRLSYPIEDEIPRFLIDDAQLLSLEAWTGLMPASPEGPA
jgi:uncharacterized protein YbaR (Trm112 family)